MARSFNLFKMRLRSRRIFRRRRRGFTSYRRRARPGTRRFFRRQRRVSRPEIKFTTYSTATTVVQSLSVSDPINLSPGVLLTGPGVNQKIGKSCKIRKIFGGIQFRSIDGTEATVRADGLIRVILWYPTVNLGLSSPYMTNLSISNLMQPLDWTNVRVVRDWLIPLGYENYVFTAANENFNAHNVRASWHARRFVIPWPRTVNDAAGNGLLDVNKEILYMTILNPNTWAINYDFDTKMTFIDA